MSSNVNEDDKLMHSVMDGGEETDDGKLVEDALNQGVGTFIPDMMYSQMTQNYSQAKQMYGERMLRELTGYDDDYIEKNAKIPEFQRELKSKIGQKIKDLKDKGILDDEGNITSKGFKLASLVMYTEELDHLEAKGLLGDKKSLEKSHYGERDLSWKYKKGDRYVDIDVRKTIKSAIKRGHKKITSDDLRIFERVAEGGIEIIYAIDASGSMKGKRIEMSKKAGVALAYKAIDNKDKVGIIAFGSEVKAKVKPTDEFFEIIRELTEITASKETDFGATIDEAINLFSPNKELTKHLVFITDGMPTVGKEPEKLALDAIAKATAAGITCSMIGVEIDAEAAEFLKEAAELGNGNFHEAKNSENLDSIILEDYSRL